MKQVILLLILILSLSACTKKNPKTDIQKTMEQAQKQMYGNKPMKCTYEFDNGTEKFITTTYIKKGKMRSSMGDMQTITDSEYVYSWSEKDKTGMKMSLAEAYENQPEGQTKMPTKEELEDMEVMIKDMQEEFKADCKAENFSDSLFEVPSDVTFTDLSEQMKQMKEMGEKFQNMEGQGMGSEDAQKMMEEAGEMLEKMQFEE